MKKIYYTTMIVVVIIQLIICISTKDAYFSFLSSAAITLYIFFIMQGKKIGLYFGLLFDIIMFIYSWQNKLYGTSINNIAIQLPLVIISLIKWNKSKANIFTNLKISYFIISIIIQFIVYLCFYLILIYTNDAQPILDSAVFSLSCGAMIFLYLKYKLYWIWNVICGIINSTLWTKIFLDNCMYNNNCNGLTICFTDILLTCLCFYAVCKLYFAKK